MLTLGVFYNQQYFSYLFILCLGVLLVNMICGEVATENDKTITGIYKIILRQLSFLRSLADSSQCASKLPLLYIYVWHQLPLVIQTHCYATNRVKKVSSK